jgi:hypothetical protein
MQVKVVLVAQVVMLELQVTKAQLVHRAILEMLDLTE